MTTRLYFNHWITIQMRNGKLSLTLSLKYENIVYILLFKYIPMFLMMYACQYVHLIQSFVSCDLENKLYCIVLYRCALKTHHLQLTSLFVTLLFPRATLLIIIFDEDMDVEEHITSCVVQTVFFHIYNIGFTRKYLTQQVTEKLVHVNILPRPDYCNSLFYGLPHYLGQRLLLQCAKQLYSL